MRTSNRHAVLARAAILTLALLLLFPALAAAHAELETSSPADGDTVEGTPAEITADFTEGLIEGSSFELRDAGGAMIAEGGIDPADDGRMTIDPPDLAPGEYEVQWQARAEDGHLERGTYSFTVEAVATAPPTPSAPQSAAATDTAVASEPPSTSSSTAPTPTPDAEPATSTSDVLLPIIVAVVLLAVLAGYLLNRRRATPGP